MSRPEKPDLGSMTAAGKHVGNQLSTWRPSPEHDMLAVRLGVGDVVAAELDRAGLQNEPVNWQSHQ